MDVREFGSGRTGMSNVLRTGGGKSAAVVLALDIAKGVVVVICWRREVVGTYRGRGGGGPGGAGGAQLASVPGIPGRTRHPDGAGWAVDNDAGASGGGYGDLRW